MESDKGLQRSCFECKDVRSQQWGSLLDRRLSIFVRTGLSSCGNLAVLTNVRLEPLKALDKIDAGLVDVWTDTRPLHTKRHAQSKRQDSS